MARPRGRPWPADDQGDLDAAQRQRLQRGVERIRARQLDGELTSAVSAEFVLLLAHLVAFAPIAMQQLVEAVLGVDAYSTDYRWLCTEQLLALLERHITRESDRSN